jgi:DNA polymerase III gamma/tau subunit
MAMGGMRDAQSILDQMISFCGKTISQTDVLEVYGLASKERISSLAELIINADYDAIIKLSDSFSNEGVDFYRALLDLSGSFREFLLGILRSNDSIVKCQPEQCVRILDSLRHGEDLVRMGLSEKTNFEVTLFRAVEAGRTRSIDQVIRKISGMLPDDVKKKTELKSATDPQFERPKYPVEQEEKGAQFEDSKISLPSETKKKADQEVSFFNDNQVEKGKDQLSVEEEPSSSPISKELEDVESTRRIIDREKIEAKIAELPDGIRAVLEEKFQADFVSIEKIDMDKLI